MENISIRPAAENDIAGIAAVNIACWRSAYRNVIDKDFLAEITTEGFAAHCRERFSKTDTLLHIAENGGSQIVGYCGGGPNDGSPHDYDAEIYSIYILDEYQEKGLGKKLIHSVLSILADMKYSSVLVWSLRDNPNRRFYEALGGQLILESHYEIGGKDYATVCYGWEDIRDLLKNTTPDC